MAPETRSAISSPTDWRPTRTPASACTRTCVRSRAPSPTSSWWRAGWPRACADAASGRVMSVALQLPNWMEAAAVFWASAFLGAVVVPIVHFYGRKELSHIMSTARPQGVHHRRGVRADDSSSRTCARTCRSSVWWDATSTTCSPTSRWSGRSPPTPASPALIAFTSGTTSDPKGVVHSHQTLGFETRQLLANYPPDRGRQLTATPVGHFIGMLGAFLIPVLEGASIDLVDVWDPGQGAEADETNGLSIGGGPPYFVTSLLDHPDCTADTCRTSRPSASADRPCPPRSPAGWPISASSCSGPTAAPSIRRSPGSSPRRARGQAAVHRRRCPGREWRSGSGDDGEIFSRGPGPVPRLHRRRR